VSTSRSINSAATGTAPTVVRPWVALAAAVLVFVVTWIFRWLTVDFTNDHFVHLSRARQILLGELPIRDFFDPGLPLHYFASSAALAIFGQTLFGEALLTVTLVALGGALTFYLSARASRSLALALVAAAAAIAMFPRLYNYPKVFLYPLAVLTIWLYAAKRTTASLVLLACVAALAALYRLDHGLYIALAAGMALILANTDRVRSVPRELVRFAAVAGVLLLPFFLFIQTTAGLVQFMADLRSQADSVTTARLLWIPFTVDSAKPWVVFDPPARPRVFVRWKDGVDADVRTERERRYGLTDGLADGSYVLANDRRDAIEALVNDAVVADTHNIDRVTFRPVVAQSWLQRARNRLPVLRMHLAPGVFTFTNAIAWLYYVTILVPLAAILVMIAAWRRGALDRAQLAAIGTTTALCVVIHQSLIRGSPDSRLPDVAGPTMVLAAWVTAQIRTWRLPWMRVAALTAAVVVWAGTLWSAAALGELSERITVSGVLGGPTATRDRMREVTRLVRLRPIDFYAPVGSTGVRGLTRYVLECTRPSDRVLAGAFEPQMFFYSERAFAGGQVYLKNGWHSSETDQRLTIERIRHQRVPLVLLRVDTEPDLQQAFPLVYEYVRENYRQAARSDFGGGASYDVFVKRDLHVRGTYAPGFPCFR
jgi:hypothetical protein